jgi:hypothetical protein
MTDPCWLLDHAKSHYSQTGEDGILEKILELLPERDEWCVEFGAWDGEYLSNTYHFVKNHGFSAVLIEGDPKKARALAKKFKDNSKIHCKSEYVGWTAGSNLDSILESTPIPRNFDLLSIDIDGNDYHVWKAVKKFSPKIVVIEFNPTVPNGINFVQKADPLVHQGCSIDALRDLGKEKGYELICVTAGNAFFIDERYFGLFKISNNTTHDLRRDQSFVTWFFSGYDGTVFLDGYQRLPWHGCDIRPSAVQPLPAFLRKFPGAYNWFQRRFLGIYRRIVVGRN